jgi:hypothetical protein
MIRALQPLKLYLSLLPFLLCVPLPDSPLPEVRFSKRRFRKKQPLHKDPSDENKFSLRFTSPLDSRLLTSSHIDGASFLDWTSCNAVSASAQSSSLCVVKRPVPPKGDTRRCPPNCRGEKTHFAIFLSELRSCYARYASDSRRKLFVRVFIREQFPTGINK